MYCGSAAFLVKNDFLVKNAFLVENAFLVKNHKNHQISGLFSIRKAGK